MTGHNEWVWDCDFTIDLVYCLTVSTDKKIRIWGIADAKIKIAIPAHSKGITSLVFSDVMFPNNG